MSDSELALHLVSGAIIMGYLVAGLFFLRFWRETRDRLFLIFAISFWILGVQRVLLAWTSPSAETRPGLYLIRLFAFVLILLAVVDRNRRSEPSDL
jgi:uncharacterized membrane protein